MDPLSATASAITLLQVTTELVKVTRKYYKNVKNAPKEIADLIDQLNLFTAVLDRLKETSEKADATSPAHIAANGSNSNSQTAGRLPLLKRMLQEDGPLFICYQEMLTFKRKLSADQSRLRKSLKWPFEKDEVGSAVARLRNLQSALETAIVSDNLALTLEIRDSMSSIKSTFQTAATENSSRQISAWLSAPDPATNLATARNKRQQDTGIWLLESSSLSTWKTKPCSFLWIQGKAGSGKTVLSSTVIHSLLEESQDDSKVVFFYFDFQSREKLNVQGLLSSIALQLNCDDPSFRALEAFYKSHAHGNVRPTLQDLKGLVRRMISSTKAVYLVIDALDECEERQHLLESLEEMRSWNQANLHILTTSRREPDIAYSLTTIATETISLEASVVDEDILSFVRHELQHDIRLSKWREEVRQDIESALLAGANGMFRWVECQLNAIRGCLKPGLLRKILKSLPKTLHDTYARILNNIPDDYTEDARRILSCLICSFHPLAIEEIADTVAIVVDGDTFYDADNRLSQARDVLSICSGLVTTAGLTRETYFGWQPHGIKELRLEHFSVKEYLVSDQTSSIKAPDFVLDERQAHETLANLCMHYLEWCHKEKFCEDPQFLWKYAILRSEEVPFGPYAAASWCRHLRAAHLDSSSPLVQHAMRIVTDPAFLRDVIKLHPPWFRYKETMIMQKCGYADAKGGEYKIVPTFEPVPPLYYAALLGMDQLVVMLLEAGEDVNSDCAYGTCLAAAVCGGYRSTVELLLEKGVNVNARVVYMSGSKKGIYSRTAVHEAIYGTLHEEVAGSNEELVELLIKWGADANPGVSYAEEFDKSRDSRTYNIEESDFETPLSTAINMKNKNIIRLLIGGGVDLGAPAGGITALERMSSDIFMPDGVEVMSMILDAGVSPNVTTDPRGVATPLYMAIYSAYPAAVRLLLERGADLPSQTILETRLIPYLLRDNLAGEGSFIKAVDVLAQLRSFVPIKLPLTAPAKYGYSESIAELLKHGAAPDLEEQEDVTPLQAAAFTPANDTETFELLLDAGAVIDTTGGPFGSALQAASLSGKAKVVQKLLEKGTSVNHTGGEYGTALQIARKRLDDYKAQCPAIWEPSGRVDRYGSDRVERYGGPTGYYTGKQYPSDATKYSMQGVAKNGDYEAKINILHSPNAEYQAVIDLLLSYGAVDV